MRGCGKAGQGSQHSRLHQCEGGRARLDTSRFDWGMMNPFQFRCNVTTFLEKQPTQQQNLWVCNKQNKNKHTTNKQTTTMTKDNQHGSSITQQSVWLPKRKHPILSCPVQMHCHHTSGTTSIKMQKQQPNNKHTTNKTTPTTGKKYLQQTKQHLQQTKQHLYRWNNAYNKWNNTYNKRTAKIPTCILHHHIMSALSMACQL